MQRVKIMKVVPIGCLDGEKGGERQFSYRAEWDGAA